MPRIQGLAETGVLTGDQLVKEAPGEVHSFVIAWRGANVGDVIAYLLDAITDTSANPGTHEVVIIAATANGTFAKEYPQGKRFDTGIFYKEGAANNVFTEVTFK